MNKFLTLMKKDYYINRKNLFMPIWITAGYYVLVIIGILIAYFRSRHGLELGIDMSEMFSEPTVVYTVNYVANAVVLSLPSFLCIIFTIILTQSALNEDIRRNYELFHRSQPVSIWYRTLSKYVVGIGGLWVVFLAIGLVTFVGLNIVIAIVGKFHFGVAFTGLLQTFIVTAKVTLLLGSLCFFCSAIFKDKAFLQGLSILIGVHFLFMVLNGILGWNLPLPLSYLIKLFNLSSGFKFTLGADMESSFAHEQIFDIIQDRWNHILFNWKSLLQVVVSGVLFAAATFIYKLKEIK